MKNSTYVLIITFCFVFLFSFSVIAQDQQSNIDNQINMVKNNYNNLQERINELEKKVSVNDETISRLGTIETKKSNYFTLISILAALIAVIFPLVNIFTVVLPTRKLHSRLQTIEKEVPQKIEDNFDEYMEKFERNRHKKILSELEKGKNINYVINYLLASYNQEFDEDDYKKIITYLNKNPKLESDISIVLLTTLQDHNSNACRNYFRKIFEDEGNQYTEYAIEFFANSNIEEEINYLEKIIISRSDTEGLLIKFVEYIEENYLGDHFDKKPPEKIKTGKKKIKILLNNKKIVTYFDRSNRGELEILNSNFLDNDNKLNAFPFYKDTLLYKKHYEENE